MDCSVSMRVCMLTNARICECVLCQRCAKNLLPQRFSLSHTHTHRSESHSWHSPPSASRFCSGFYPSTSLLIGNIFTFCSMHSLWHSPVSYPTTGANKCTSTRGSHRCGRGVVAPRGARPPSPSPMGEKTEAENSIHILACRS